jgi:NADPH2:quinone reductase
MAKSVSLSGGILRNFIATRRDLLRRSREVLKAIREGWLKLTIGGTFPLAEAAQAHRMIEDRQSTGKIVLRIAG